MHCNSSAIAAVVSAAIGASGSTGMFGANMGVAGRCANANSNALQNSGRSMSQFFHEQLKQSVNQNAAGYLTIECCCCDFGAGGSEIQR
jgi:hypothetical protein